MIRLIEFLIYGHIHKWVECSFFNYIDTSYGLRNPSHYMTYKCERCNKHKKEILSGFKDKQI